MQDLNPRASRAPWTRLSFAEMDATSGQTSVRVAAAIILLRQNTDPANPELFWVQRSERLAFLGGYHAFPGGELEPSDIEAPIKNSRDTQTSAAISAAARELFEELGVLVVRGGDLLTDGQRSSLLDDLESKRMSWPQLLRHYDLHLDASDFTFVGRWVTPPFSARRFDTWFFLVQCPLKQTPRPSSPELAFGEWISAKSGYKRWKNSEVVIAPPTLHAIQTLADGLTADYVRRFLSVSQAHCEPVRRIEFRPGFICFPVRTPTKPPATHTNCYLVYNSREVLVIDPGSPYEGEQAALARCLDDLLSDGRELQAIALTHMHPDHVSGVNALLTHLSSRATVAAHPLTAQFLGDTVRVDRYIGDGELLTLKGSPEIQLRAMHTPGHVPGHLCFYEAVTGTLISGDNIVGLGSVLIDPPHGNMRAYLRSLEQMRALPNLSVIFGGHGPAIANPYSKVNEYISHRLDREQQIIAAVRSGIGTAKEIVTSVYTDLSPQAQGMAERITLAHLEKLEEDGLVRRDGASSEEKSVWYARKDG